MADVAVFFATAFAIFGAPTWLLLDAVREFRRRGHPARFAPKPQAGVVIALFADTAPPNSWRMPPDIVQAARHRG
jgi:hypothetical protein